MPYKHHENRRHKFTKPKYKVTNWPEYNEALRRRGDITIWFSTEAIHEWRPARTGVRGRPQEYSEVAIETAVLIRQVFHLPLRQTEGFMNSLALILKADITIPDFSSISRRSIELPRHVLCKVMELGSLVIVDSPDLRSTAKTSGTRTNTTFRRGVPGASCIWPSMKTIRFWHANSRRRRSAIPLPFRICLTKLPPRSRPSWATGLRWRSGFASGSGQATQRQGRGTPA